MLVGDGHALYGSFNRTIVELKLWHDIILIKNESDF